MLYRINTSILETSRSLVRRSLAAIRPETSYTPIDDVADNQDDPNVFGTFSQRGRKKLAVQEVEKFYPEDKDGYDEEKFDLEPRKNAYFITNMRSPSMLAKVPLDWRKRSSYLRRWNWKHV